MKRSKRYNEAQAKVEALNLYAPLQAVRLVKENAKAKFDETVEVHIKLGVDPRKADQQIRGTVVLPHGTGRSVRIAVFAQAEKAQEAQAAGADFVGAADLVEKVSAGWTDFDVAVATPDMMGAVGKLGKMLGAKGLMPNPKSGTVTFDVGKAVKDIKAGKVEYRLDKSANVHLILGKASFDEVKLVENYSTLIDEIIRVKPSAAKGKYIRGIAITSTMGVGVKVDPMKLRNLMEE